MESHSDFFTVSLEETSTRLDKLLSLHFPGYSRTYFQYLIDQQSVIVNGECLKKRHLLKVGDEVEVCFLLTPEISLEPQEMPLDILFEDAHLIAVNKPAGMVVHPAPGHPDQTFVNALLHHCRSMDFIDSVRPGIVHRLDKDTSGVLLAAKTTEAHAKLVEMFSGRRIEKDYLAICIGTPQEGLIDAPMRRHPTRRKEMAVCFEHGKEAKTRCKVLGKNGQLSLVQIQLLTGRTHQIRVHLKHIGAPVLGDAVYGNAGANKKFNVKRQLLHASRLQFLHPITNFPVELFAPVPKDLLLYTEIFHT